MRLDYLPTADADLLDIYSYIAADNERAASRQIYRIRTSLDRLRTFPTSAPLRPDVAPTARGLSVDRYVALYRVAEKVEIVRIVHTARDMKSFTADF